MSTSGKLIVVEGARGSGKSTCLRTVAEQLRDALGLRVCTTSEPTRDNAPGALARRVLAGQDALADARAFQLLCAADRLEHVALTIGPALARGEVVLCDRYVLSSTAHAPANVEGAWALALAANAAAPLADLTVVLCVPMEECGRRLVARGDGPDALAATTAAPELFYKMHSAYARDYAHSRNVVFVDGTAPPGHVATQVLTEILAELAS